MDNLEAKNEVKDELEYLYKVPFTKLYEFVKLTYTTDTSVISVGSGFGAYEYKLRENGIHNIICVDTSPESFRPYPRNGKCIKPAYKTVDSLLSSKLNLDNCVLLLIWPNPNESSYDYDAIVKLKPKSIVLIYETYGGSGGFKLHDWINSQKEYSEVANHNVIINGGGFSGQHVKLTLLSRDSEIKKLSKVSTTENVDDNSVCVIM